MLHVAKKGRKFSCYTLVLVLGVVMIINLESAYWKVENRVIQNDATQYYAYLPAIFIYNDLSLQIYHKDAQSLGATFFPKRSPTWELVILTTYGLSVLYFPFFITAHFLAPHLGYEANGLTLPYQFAIQMGTWIYLLLGLVYLRKLLLKYFEDKVVAVVLAATVLATNMLWYATGEAAMSHVYSFFLITIYLYLTDRWLEKASLMNTLMLGFIVGLITLVRPTNVIIGVLILLWKVSSPDELKSRVQYFFKHWHFVLLVGFVFFLMWLPQLLYWKMIAGTWFYYSYPEEQGFYFNNPQLFNNLFSWRKGWFIYMPVMVFSIVGIGLLYKIKKPFFLSVLIYWLLTWYILSSWWSWGYGGGLSIRPYIDSYAIFSLGMAAFLSWTFRQRLFLKMLVMTIFLVASFTGIQSNARYARGSLHWDGNTRQTYLVGFFQIE
ncbi:MAG: hypothetical protein K9H16_14815, partial [Bacteroidales bacterium]|nr:hypothetical protein [Bacteroidales bacterium]